MQKVITVFGATGHQGGAVARALARDRENFSQVRGVTRDVHQEVKVEELKNSGVTAIPCDLDNIDQIKMSLRDADGCFLVTYTDFDDPQCIEIEKQRGMRIADACAELNIKHVIYSTQLHTTRVQGIQVRHLVAKAEVEDYIKSKYPNMSFSSIMVPCYYENFFDLLRPRRVDGNNFVLEIPMGTTPLDLISVEDIGEVVRIMFLNGPNFRQKTLSLCGDKLTIREIAAEMSRQLRPLSFRDRPVTVNEYKGFGKPWSMDFANMFDFFLRKDQQYHLEHTLEIHPATQRFAQWLQNNANRLNNVYANI